MRYSRVLITGSRTWTDTRIIRDALAAVWHPDTILVSGACPEGADWLCEDCWTHWGGTVQRWPADWKRHGRAAGPQRNHAMIRAVAPHHPAICLAFIRQRSRGASHCAAWADTAGIPTITYTDQCSPHPDDLPQ